jgi:hypothetical protein
MAKYVIIVDDNVEYLKSFSELGGVTAEWGEIDWFTQTEGDVEEVASDAVVFEDVHEAKRVAKLLNEALFVDEEGDEEEDEDLDGVHVQSVELVTKYRFVDL